MNETHSHGLKNEHRHCVICGDRNPLSLRLLFHPTNEGVQARFQAHAGLQGYDGILHGGVIASLLDAAMTHCLFDRGICAVTVDLRIRYLLPAPCAALLDLKAWVISSKILLHHLKAEMACNGNVLASAEAQFMQRHA